MTNDELDQQTINHDARKGERVLDQVYDFLGRFVSYPNEETRVAHTLWCLHAHLMHLWTATPRLAFLSAEPASGKSRALEITAQLVPNPVLAVNMSPAYLFRKVGEQEGAVTILFDEIDTIFGPKARENEEIRGLLNAGHRKGAVAGRCVVRGKTVETEECPAYAALAVAGIGWLPDTLMSRSIVVRMRRRAADEVVEPYRPRLHDPEGASIRSHIELWARSISTIDLNAITVPPEIEDRDADCWEPLLATAEAAGGAWPERAREAGVLLVLAGKDREASLGVKLLTDIEHVFTDTLALSTKELLRRLVEMEESPWGDIRGKPLNERGLAHRLGEYDIKSCQIRIGDTTPRGYRREDFLDAWKRYATSASPRSKTSKTDGSLLDVLDVLDLREANPEPAQIQAASQSGAAGEVPDPDGYTFQYDDYPELPEHLRRQ